MRCWLSPGFRGFAVAFLLALGAPAEGQVYTITAVALPGDPAPGTGGGAYTADELSSAVVGATDSGGVVFQTAVVGGTANEGIFLDSGGADTALVLSGEAAPGTGGGTYSGLDRPSTNGSGDLAFRANVSGGSVSEGIFFISGGVHTARVLLGDAAPGPAFGTYSGFSPFSVNASGQVGFVAGISGGTATQGIFVDSGGTDAAVALMGDPTPGGGVYNSLDGFFDSINGAGDVAFGASILDFNPALGIFVDSGGTETEVARTGDTAPGTGGGTYLELLGSPNYLDDSGRLAFVAPISGGTVPLGIFQSSGGTVNPLVLPGEPAPGTGGGTFSSLGNPNLNAAGDVVFLAHVSGGTVSEGIFVLSGGTRTAVILEGETLPGTAGGTYSRASSSSIPFLNASGQVAFAAIVDGGTVPEGIFLASPRVPSVPAVSGLGVAALAGFLLATGLVALGVSPGRRHRAPYRGNRCPPDGSRRAGGHAGW